MNKSHEGEKLCVNAGKTKAICLFVCFCCFTSHVNSYGHCGTSVHLTTFFPGQG